MTFFLNINVQGIGIALVMADVDTCILLFLQPVGGDAVFFVFNGVDSRPACEKTSTSSEFVPPGRIHFGTILHCWYRRHLL